MAVDFAEEGPAFDLTEHVNTCSLPRLSSIGMCVCDVCLSQCVRWDVFVCCGFACCECFLLALVLVSAATSRSCVNVVVACSAELLSANHARSSFPYIREAVDAVLKRTPNRPLYWVGVSNGGVPAAACADLYGGAGLLLLSAMPALGQQLPAASCPVLAAVGDYEHFWGGADRLSAGICRCMLDSTCHMVFVADVRQGFWGTQLYVFC